MPTFKNSFSLHFKDMERVNLAINNLAGNAEEVINDYLHKTGGEKISDSITKFLPVSKKGTKHAKSSKWFEQENFNLAVSISNSIKGKRGSSFYYLYYVFTGTGTSRKKGPNDAMIKGYKKVENELVENLIDSLDKKIEQEMNNK